MKKPILLVVALALAGVCCVVSAYFCQFYYTRYQNTVTELEYRINSFDMRLATLEGHKSRELTPVRVWEMISTTDRPADSSQLLEVSPGGNGDDFFETVKAKCGPVIRPEFMLPAASTT